MKVFYQSGSKNYISSRTPVAMATEAKNFVWNFKALAPCLCLPPHLWPYIFYSLLKLFYIPLFTYTVNLCQLSLYMWCTWLLNWLIEPANRLILTSSCYLSRGYHRGKEFYRIIQNCMSQSVVTRLRGGGWCLYCPFTYRRNCFLSNIVRAQMKSGEQC